MPKKTFLILDFGSQYTWLIARRFRELGFYSQVESYDFSLKKIKILKPCGIVLSGGPASVLSADSPYRDLKPLWKIAPLLGICYGFQMICQQWGGKVQKNQDFKSRLKRHYGSARLHWKSNLFQGMQKVWMSHGDFVSEVPKGFSVLAKTDNNTKAALKFKNILALQFHPEVSHTKKGGQILSYFANKICKVKKGEWSAELMLSLLSDQIKLKVSEFGLPLKDGFSSPAGKVKKSRSLILCALSGGVDSTVMALLLTKVLGQKFVHSVFVDTGLLRQNEFQEVCCAYKKLGLNLKALSEGERFLKALKGLVCPEKKRKTIGRLFIDIFKEYKDKHPEIKYLAQGTLYPDVIESLSFKGPSAVIKSHHNVGGLPKNLPFKLLEPLRFLFKDEVRTLGKKLNVPSEFLNRHPFPGPGLAVRICGKITKTRLQKLRKADAIFIEELLQSKLYKKIWQAFAVLLPVKSVGVQGDQRTYDEVISLRAVTSKDGMTADWFSFPPDFLHKVSDRITNEVKGINRVVYDISSKPPGTIEWL